VVAGALILLASNSPRRKELLALGNWTFTVCVANVDESRRTNELPVDYVLRLAEAKVRAAIANTPSEQFILGADTVVVDGNDLLGKPKDTPEAVQMLRRLRGHVHQVYTGLAVFSKRDGQLLKDLCVTAVPMRNYSDAEIDAYVRSGDPLDKAGAYAIQHPQFQPVENLRGCFASVMGLPLCHLVRLFQKLGLELNGGVPGHCQTYLNYECPVSTAILRGEQVG
jgi:MAF protein